MATVGEWVGGARPRTLPAAIAPVAVGAGLGAWAHAFDAWRALLALVVAVALQVGVNYANDYSDGVRGTDEKRVGPVRLVGQGLAAPRAVKTAAWLSFAVAAVAGLVLVLATQEWWLLLVGVASVAAAWLYTGGPRPYGYAGLGEVFVFVFFGLVPVVFTAYVQTLTITAAAVVGGIGVGLLSCAILITNNLRDIPGDTVARKQTLAVRLGDARTRVLYAVVVVGGLLAVIVLAALTSWLVALAVLSGLLAVRPVRIVLGGARGPALIPALKQTGLLLLAYGVAAGALLAVAALLR
jgi:1,4-dihydroxy-2-naphthoate octaprenyltransferase